MWRSNLFQKYLEERRTEKNGESEVNPVLEEMNQDNIDENFEKSVPVQTR